MRAVGLDVGLRRIGVAISDPSRTLARPLGVLTVVPGAEVMAQVLGEIARLQGEEESVDTIVVGYPRRLDGTPTHQTASIAQLASDLAARTGLTVVLQDERLTSVEAESRLARRERDWRARKARVDAAAAAVILQDYLDSMPRNGSALG